VCPCAGGENVCNKVNLGYLGVRWCRSWACEMTCFPRLLLVNCVKLYSSGFFNGTGVKPFYSKKCVYTSRGS
jgi:hypothetical protein